VRVRPRSLLVPTETASILPTSASTYCKSQLFAGSSLAGKTNFSLRPIRGIGSTQQSPSRHLPSPATFSPELLCRVKALQATRLLRYTRTSPATARLHLRNRHIRLERTPCPLAPPNLSAPLPCPSLRSLAGVPDKPSRDPLTTPLRSHPLFSCRIQGAHPLSRDADEANIPLGTLRIRRIVPFGVDQQSPARATECRSSDGLAGRLDNSSL
jgi:hypothetical protein